MKQRVALAAAMLGSPTLLVLDEPANGLDPEQRLQLRSLLSTSHTVLMSTHNISEVSALCHRVYVMFAGRVRFTGTPAELAGLAAERVWEDDIQDPRADPQLAHRDRHLPPPRRPARGCAGRRPDARRRLPPARQTRAQVMTAWLVPTARATPWQPMAAVGVFLGVVSALAAHTGRWPISLFGVAAAAVAAAVVIGLRDRAANLLAAVPTSAEVRRTRRLTLLVPVGIVVWLTYLWPAQALVPWLGWPLGPLVALISTGVALAASAPRAALAVGVAVPLVWAASARAAGGLDDDVSFVLFAWQHHPWIVTLAALAALLIGRQR